MSIYQVGWCTIWLATWHVDVVHRGGGDTWTPPPTTECCQDMGSACLLDITRSHSDAEVLECMGPGFGKCIMIRICRCIGLSGILPSCQDYCQAVRTSAVSGCQACCSARLSGLLQCQAVRTRGGGCMCMCVCVWMWGLATRHKLRLKASSCT